MYIGSGNESGRGGEEESSIGYFYNYM